MIRNETVQRLLASAGLANVDSGAGTTGATTLTGKTVDTHGITGRRFNKIRCEWGGEVNFASGRQLVLTSVLRDSSASGGTYADFATGTTKTIVHATTATSSITAFAFRNEYVLDSTAKRHVREVITHQFQTTAAAGTTATGSNVTMQGVMTLAEPNRLPASG